MAPAGREKFLCWADNPIRGSSHRLLGHASVVQAVPFHDDKKGGVMFTGARRNRKAGACVPRTVLIVIVTVLIASWVAEAQTDPVGDRSKECRQLLKKKVSQLTDEELRTLKVCLEPLERRKKEKVKSADQILAPAERNAPLRIYGK